MTRPGLILLAVAAAYPIVSFAALWLATAPFGIPSMEQWFLFAGVAPFCTVATVAYAKTQGSGAGWWAITAFAGWVAFVAYAHHWLITGIWAVI